jgi:hypothetical protein
LLLEKRFIPMNSKMLVDRTDQSVYRMYRQQDSSSSDNTTGLKRDLATSEENADESSIRTAIRSTASTGRATEYEDDNQDMEQERPVAGIVPQEGAH